MRALTGPDGQLSNQKGFTLMEALIAITVGAFVFMSLMASFLSIKTLNQLAKRNLQAAQVVRGEIERLRGGVLFENIVDAATDDVAYDAGPDHDFSTTGDNLTGTLTVQVADFLDMDGDGTQAACVDNNNDGVTDTNCFDADGDGTLDSTVKPVRVTFSWSQTLFGNTQNFNVQADTLISR